MSPAGVCEARFSAGFKGPREPLCLHRDKRTPVPPAKMPRSHLDSQGERQIGEGEGQGGKGDGDNGWLGKEGDDKPGLLTELLFKLRKV